MTNSALIYYHELDCCPNCGNSQKSKLGNYCGMCGVKLR